MLIMLNTQEEKSIGKGDRIAEQQKKKKWNIQDLDTGKKKRKKPLCKT